DIGDVQTVARRLRAVDQNLQLWNFACPVDEGTGYAADAGDDVQNFRRPLPEHGRIVAEHLDDDLAVDLRNALEDVVADRLRNRRFETGNAADRLFHLGGQILPRNPARPLRRRLQVDEEL